MHLTSLAQAYFIFLSCKPIENGILESGKAPDQCIQLINALTSLVSDHTESFQRTDSQEAIACAMLSENGDVERNKIERRKRRA